MMICRMRNAYASRKFPLQSSNGYISEYQSHGERFVGKILWERVTLRTTGLPSSLVA